MAIIKKSLGNDRRRIFKKFREIFSDGEGGLRFDAFCEGWKAAWNEKGDKLQAKNERLKEEVLKNWRRGYESALCDFAWWKDGVQYVGCGIKTLKEVIEQLDKQALKNKGGGQVEVKGESYDPHDLKSQGSER